MDAEHIKSQSVVAKQDDNDKRDREKNESSLRDDQQPEQPKAGAPEDEAPEHQQIHI